MCILNVLIKDDCDSLISDINECTDDDSLCEHQCVNSIGSYECSCNNGFVLGENGMCIGMFKTHTHTHK